MLARTSGYLALSAFTTLLGVFASSACYSRASSAAAEDGGDGADAGGEEADGDVGSSSGQPSQPGKDGGGAGADGNTSGGIGGCGANKICENFDKGSAIDPQWTQVANGGTVAIVASGLSAPNALAIEVEAGGSVYLDKEFSFTTKVHCEMDMKIEKLPTQGDLDLFSITSKTAAGDYYVFFAQSGTGFVFAEFAEQLPGGGSVDKKQPITAPPTGSFFHVVFDNDNKSATLTVNGATTTLTGLAQPSGTNRNAQIGTPFSQSTDATSRVLYDNVVCTFGN
jgi:hypothetical protein